MLLVMKQPPAGYTGLVGIGCLYLEEDDEAAGIRNLREVNNVERDVIRVRRWSIVPRLIKGKGKQFAGGLGSSYNDIIYEI